MRNWRKDLTIAAVVLVAALVVSQAFRINKINPQVRSDISAAPEISVLLRRACYNCHSSETVWPWYSNVAPVSWLIASDVSEGRSLLNFSDWGTYVPDLKIKKLRKIAEEVAGGDMPPWYYNTLHPEARLSEAERAQIRTWSEAELTHLGQK
ncbi:MAG TPA: heme-binding domain-containing protein [Acidobacteriota bacterium]|nr:heme-binding domain-containing protein [Acidobacteriota bacterium]